MAANLKKVTIVLIAILKQLYFRVTKNCVGKSYLNTNTVLSLLLETLLLKSNPITGNRSVNALTYLQDQGFQIKWFESVS